MFDSDEEGVKVHELKTKKSGKDEEKSGKGKADKLTINAEYAAKYQHRKEREELSRLQDKYGTTGLTAQEDDDASSSETEDEDAELLTPAIEQDIFRTISLLKNKDPRIYQKEMTFFPAKPASGEAGDDDETLSEKKSKKSKPITLKDYERKRLLERGSKAFVSDDEDEEDAQAPKKSKSYAEEQEEIRKSLKSSINVNADDSDDDDDLFKPRAKSDGEKEAEEADYALWLKGEESRIKAEAAKELDTLKRYWTDPNLNDDERFLRDYILGRGWVEKEERPTYEQVVADSADEEEVEKQELYERDYNFRFEDEAGGQIQSYPRNIEGSIRRPDTRRKTQREEREERKEKEKSQRTEELKRLKNLKKKEIFDKLKLIQEISGTNKLAFDEVDLEEDFDPEKYDAKARTMFDDDFYDQDEEGKPVFDDGLDLDDIPDYDDDEGVPVNPKPRKNAQPLSSTLAAAVSGYDDEEDSSSKKKKKKKKEKEQEGVMFAEAEMDDFIMDADYAPEQHTKHKIKTPASGTVLSKEAKARAFDEYAEASYKLDFEDLIGDQPTRFKYRKVVANDYGLTTDEIFEADDKELNQWASLKLMTQYRDEEEDQKDVRRFKRRGRSISRKKRVFLSLQQKMDEERKAHNKRKREAAEAAGEVYHSNDDDGDDDKNDDHEPVEGEDETPKTKKPRKDAEKARHHGADDSEEITKMKKKKKKKTKSHETESSVKSKKEEPLVKEQNRSHADLGFDQNETKEQRDARRSQEKLLRKQQKKQDDAALVKRVGSEMDVDRLAAYGVGSHKRKH